MINKVTVSAPGKIILSGEHVVVHGYPALVASVSLRTKVTIEETSKNGVEYYPLSAKEILELGVKNFEDFSNAKVNKIKISLDSQVPIGSGMGSSASVAVSVIGALFQYFKNNLNKESVFDLANLSEQFYHKKSSGVDPTICTYGGLLWYRKETEKVKLISRIRSSEVFGDLVIVNTGRPLETTGEMVSMVAKRLEKNPDKTYGLFMRIEKLTRKIAEYIEGSSQYSLVSLLQENEEYLEKLGVVSSSTKKLVRKIENLGGSAKIAGAGGLKGSSGMVIAIHPDREKLLAFLRKENLEVLDVKFGTEGVKIEK